MKKKTKKKTLFDVTGLSEKRPSDEPIPHVFHRRGKVPVTANVLITTPDGVNMPFETDEHRMGAYAYLAAGDQMVPYASAGGQTIKMALRMAVATQLATETGVLNGVPSSETKRKETYYLASYAVSQLGTVNEKDIMKVVQKELRSRGLKMQAKVLPSLACTAVDYARYGDEASLEMFYSQFHALFGSESSPEPKPKPDPEPKGRPDGPFIEPKPSHDAGRWGKMSVADLDLKKAKRDKAAGEKIRRWKYSEFGVFKYPWRSLPSSDYRCFSVRRKKYSGTVLFDMSGSMHVAAEHVNKVLELAPFASIAGYGSDPELGPEHGVLAIIAKDGKVGSSAYARETIGSGNVVDGPALQWLSRQAKPRIWISDGGVTGIGDHVHINLTEEAREICRSAGIIRITLPLFLKQLE